MVHQMSWIMASHHVVFYFAQFGEGDERLNLVRQNSVGRDWEPSPSVDFCQHTSNITMNGIGHWAVNLVAETQ